MREMQLFVSYFLKTHTRGTHEQLISPVRALSASLPGSRSASVRMCLFQAEGGFLTKACKLPSRNQQEATLIKARQNQHEKHFCCFCYHHECLSHAPPVSSLWTSVTLGPTEAFVDKTKDHSGGGRHVVHKMRWKRRKIWKPLRTCHF